MIRSMTTELDKRHVGGDRYENRATDMQEKILEVLNKFTNGIITQIRPTRTRGDHGGGNDGGGNDARMMLIDTGEGDIIYGNDFLENDNRNETAGNTNNADFETQEGVDPVLRDLKPKKIMKNWENMREGSMKLVT